MAVSATAWATGVVPADAGSAPSSATVVLKHVAFHKMTTTIRKGGHVTFDWEDAYVDHTVTSVGKLRFKSASARQTGTYTVHFTKKGTYNFVCTIHPGMMGKIVVK